MEGQIKFPPTYKFDMGTTNYHKGRGPSWTDRVLFSQKLPCMSLRTYDCANVTISDHRPVFAHFAVKVNKVNPEARAMVESNLIAQFNAMKMSQRAK